MPQTPPLPPDLPDRAQRSIQGTARLTVRGSHMLGRAVGTAVDWRSTAGSYAVEVADDLYIEGSYVGGSLGWRTDGEDEDPGLCDVLVVSR